MRIKSTTILAVRRGEAVAIGGDGQVSFGECIMKHTAKKLRRLYDGRVLAGFAGAVADSFALFDKFEGKLKEYKGNLLRAAVELTKEWRTDKFLRRLEALLIVADKERLLVISGNGEVIEPDDGIAAIGSGAGYALAAARALLKYSNLEAPKVVEESLRIAANICIYTNENIYVEEL